MVQACMLIGDALLERKSGIILAFHVFFLCGIAKLGLSTVKEFTRIKIQIIHILSSGLPGLSVF